jgi:hypothetical protein
LIINQTFKETPDTGINKTHTHATTATKKKINARFQGQKSCKQEFKPDGNSD